MKSIEEKLEGIDFDNPDWWFENLEKIIKDTSISSTLQNFAELGHDPRIDFTKKSFLLGRHYNFSRNHAEICMSRCSQDILNIDGMSSQKVRHLLNNICSLENINYLEIGCGTGSTLVSAMYKNSGCNFFAIDLFCEGKHDQSSSDSHEILFNRLKKYNLQESINFFEQDFKTPPVELEEKRINVYFFDGPHGVKDHIFALTKYEKFFDDSILIIIDDWKDPRVQLGTHMGLSSISYNLKYWDYLPAKGIISPIFQDTIAASRLETSFGDPLPAGDPYRWWNGVMILLLEKVS